MAELINVSLPISSPQVQIWVGIDIYFRRCSSYSIKCDSNAIPLISFDWFFDVYRLTWRYLATTWHYLGYMTILSVIWNLGPFFCKIFVYEFWFESNIAEVPEERRPSITQNSKTQTPCKTVAALEITRTAIFSADILSSFRKKKPAGTTNSNFEQ